MPKHLDHPDRSDPSPDRTPASTYGTAVGNPGELSLPDAERLAERALVRISAALYREDTPSWWDERLAADRERVASDLAVLRLVDGMQQEPRAHGSADPARLRALRGHAVDGLRRTAALHGTADGTGSRTGPAAAEDRPAR